MIIVLKGQLRVLPLDFHCAHGTFVSLTCLKYLVDCMYVMVYYSNLSIHIDLSLENTDLKGWNI